ncbi:MULTISPECIES: ribosome maturation factor RimP [Oligella]|uniref:Ribosome maturation factor RimP n=1 Tax=Oligella urethralis DNF00040 TaxID=1401065 RepID=A0A095Z3F8_9BURK|nr:MULTISPECIES: ribosome maturation factor RimP [Oligella]KGF29178.1 ribosome maturation factor RimP [Oligella urethralis DNF00040]OFS84531.1 ribosome maturation factor RimP [Oligella sp. HMSC05A10]WOS37656.1 Ribosome maturation factor RimP [Oligella urethralis]SUA56830.1 Ribosome maturation factor RimP [Oligella urethralis]SUA60565.1 Ribosome maturation factor RimP [Oligella urethralis]
MSDLFTLTEQAIQGLALELELVEVERAPLGLLRVTIDKQGGVTIDDCEQVSRLLSRIFEVEDIDYKRLEVGSPGVDRPLRTIADFKRFIGQRVECRLRHAIDNRKVFTGVLEAGPAELPEDLAAKADAESNPVFSLIIEDKKNTQTLLFCYSDVEKAKLDPVLDFRKGKKK